MFVRRPRVRREPATGGEVPGEGDARVAGLRDQHVPEPDGPAEQAAAAPARPPPPARRHHGGALLRRPHRQRPDRQHHPVHAADGGWRVRGRRGRGERGRVEPVGNAAAECGGGAGRG